MTDWAICEISGKQYKVIPNVPFEVAKQDKEVKAKVLLMLKKGKIQIGKPYLREGQFLKTLEDIKGKKIRVSKFHAKANYRRNRGFRAKLTRVIWDLSSKKMLVKK